MKKHAVYLTALLAALAGTSLSAMAAPAADGAGQPIEEITVTGQRSLLALHLKVSEAEDAMFALYNELNTDDQYDIVCKVEIRVFSHIRQKSCVPRYARDALMEEAQNLVRGQPGIPARAVLGYQAPRLDAKFQEMVGKSPELFAAVARHYELNEAWRLRRKTYFGRDKEE